MSDKMRVTIWNENRHEQINEKVRKVYPEGIGQTIAKGLQSYDYNPRIATFDQPEHGLTDEVLSQTDVLIWWGHILHREVQDQVVDRVQKYVLNGMGLIALHSSHESKIFKRLMGTTCDLKWREAAEKERLWVTEPGHPIVEGLGDYIELEQEEMYGEPFYIPTPDAQVFISWFEGGEVFRSGCCYYRGRGKIFYFRPGHETYPTYYNKDVIRVIANSINWAAPNPGAKITAERHTVVPIETIKAKS